MPWQEPEREKVKLIRWKLRSNLVSVTKEGIPIVIPLFMGT